MNRILIVDDNPQIRKMLRRHLIKKGIEIFEAENGKLALVEIEKAIPDLILLDVMMPEMDGFELCKRLQQEAATKEVPIIFMTARTEVEDVIAGLELGAVDYVTKPFNNNELMTRVNTHLELKAAKDLILVQKEELKQANAAKDKFFSIISHDLGNVFNTLIGFSSQLATQNQLSTLQPDSSADFSQRLLRASQKGYSLLSNLLEWSKSQTGTIVPQPATLNLKERVAETIELLSSNATAKSIKLFSSVSNSTTVFADKNMLDTIIRNLLTNAIKFTPANGQVEIAAKTEDTQVEISISDTGVGLLPTDIDKLFRIDVNHTLIGTSTEKGTGLGLILCQEFVEKNGGTIWVESEIGKGSTFYIRLPSQEKK